MGMKTPSEFRLKTGNLERTKTLLKQVPQEWYLLWIGQKSCSADIRIRKTKRGKMCKAAAQEWEISNIQKKESPVDEVGKN